MSREAPSDVAETGGDRLAEQREVGPGRREPAEVDLDAEVLTVREQAHRQERLGVRPERSSPAHRHRVAAAADVGRGARAAVGAAQLQLDRADAIDALLAGHLGAARQQLLNLARPLRWRPVDLAEL